MTWTGVWHPLAVDLGGRVDYSDAAAALGPVVVLAAWALGGLPLVAVRGRQRARPVTATGEQAQVTHGRSAV